MNIYLCQIDLKQEAKALAFASALGTWMSYLQDKGAVRNWRLTRRKLNLASGQSRDFMLEIEVDDMTQLDQAFKLTGAQDDAVAQKYHAVHDLIAHADFGLYRPFPDPERAERMALI